MIKNYRKNKYISPNSRKSRTRATGRYEAIICIFPPIGNVSAVLRLENFFFCAVSNQVRVAGNRRFVLAPSTKNQFYLKHIVYLMNINDSILTFQQLA